MSSLSAGGSGRCGTRAGASISLPVLSGNAAAPSRTKHTLKKSRTARWRAAVLVLVHVLMAAHIVLWFVSGMRDGVRETLAPVEPSESMYAIEGGLINAGFIFFIAAIVATLVFGRFFCGWGCHIVALQDLCGWIMKKCGVHPRPFRSRLLVYVPLIVALYMFVWPTVKREVMVPLLAGGDFVFWNATYGVWLGETARFPGWENHLIVEDFWKTFAAWYVAIPFVLVCTFGAVYFLGNKGFCTYGCPYGGFFGPADKFALGKIKVNDNCEGCGHCTAVCSSNVRVHEEVRDYGMVVDPGCMKCLDCVSVCPNEALSFGFGRPSILAKPKPEAELRRATRRGNFDLSWSGEILLALVFLGLTMGFRGMLNEVPLLMALGMAGIGTVLVWKLLQVVREPSVRLHTFQFKLKGRLRPVGALFVAVACVYVLGAAWSGAVKWTKWRGELEAVKVQVAADQLLQPGARADDAARTQAERALAMFKRSGRIADGGYGWEHRPDELQTIAYLQLVAGDIAGTERTLMEIMSRGKPLDGLVMQLGAIMKLRGASDADVAARYREVLLQQPTLHQVRWSLASMYAQQQRKDEAVRLYEEGVALYPGDAIMHKDFGLLRARTGEQERGLALIGDAVQIARGERPGMRVREDHEALRQIGRAYAQQLGRPDLALPLFEELAVLKRPQRPQDILADLANAQFFTGKQAEAVETMKRAAEENPDNAGLTMSVAQIYEALQRPDDARAWVAKAQEQQKRLAAEHQARADRIRAWRGE